MVYMNSFTISLYFFLKMVTMIINLLFLSFPFSLPTLPLVAITFLIPMSIVRSISNFESYKNLFLLGHLHVEHCAQLATYAVTASCRSGEFVLLWLIFILGRVWILRINSPAKNWIILPSILFYILWGHTRIFHLFYRQTQLGNLLLIYRTAYHLSFCSSLLTV